MSYGGGESTAREKCHRVLSCWLKGRRGPGFVAILTGSVVLGQRWATAFFPSTWGPT